MEKTNAPNQGGEEEGKKVNTGTKTAQKESNNPMSNPDTSVLEHYSPTEGAQSHPDWVKKKFPTYIEPHGKHEATREALNKSIFNSLNSSNSRYRHFL